MMIAEGLPLDQIIQGDCAQVMDGLPPDSIDLIFADPPYNLQLSQELWRPNMTRVDAVLDEWDQFEDFKAYDAFTLQWLTAARRVLKATGTIWVIGTYHNIFRIGSILQDLGYWVLNDVVWVKTNPMPNFRGVRFTNAHETLIWATKSEGARYTFNYHAMKRLNQGKQMRSDWLLPICGGKERLRINGEKVHSTQKPEALLYRILLAASEPGDVVLDPFFGTGTTGAVAKRLHRRWIGIELDTQYAQVAAQRIEATRAGNFDAAAFDVRDRRRHAKRVPFSRLLEAGYLHPGQRLAFQGRTDCSATIKPDGQLVCGDLKGSIHQVAKHMTGGRPCNGWDHWFYQAVDGDWHAIDRLRVAYRQECLE
jgi:site-specific DNA-methyltransferase (adenine-specific)